MGIHGYLPTSLIEWPGKIAAVVFVAGCNFRCPFCHNADLIDPKRIKGLPLIEEKRIFTDLKKRKKWIDGVVVTGGEPTLQTGLSGFLSRCKQIGLETMVETNGSRPEIIAKLLNGQMVDYLAMDVKGPFDRYTQITNYQLPISPKANQALLISKIKKSIKLIINSGIDFELRTTVVPKIHDRKNMIRLAKQLRNIIENCLPAGKAGKLKIENFNWYLQSFQPKNCLDPAFNKIKPYSQNEMEEILAAVREYISGAELRGE